MSGSSQGSSGRPLRLYVQAEGDAPYPITPPAVVRNVAISPDGGRVAFDGPKEEALIPARLGAVFGAPMRLTQERGWYALSLAER